MKHLAADHEFQVFLKDHLRPGDCALDVGANQGLYTSVMADLVGTSGRVEAFEANPELAAGLCRTYQHRSNVHIHQLAVSDVASVLTFFMDTRAGLGGVASSLEVLNDLHSSGNVKPVSVQSITLDSFCTLHGIAPRLIKIDVEGHELNVFRGATASIEAFRPFLIFEFWETWWNLGVKNIFDYLRPAYSLVRLQDGAVVDDFYDHHQGQDTVDIACIPRPTDGQKPGSLDPKLLTKSV